MKPDAEDFFAEAERYRIWLRSIAEVEQALFLLIDEAGDLIQGFSHLGLQKRLGIEKLVPGTPVSQLIPPLKETLQQGLALCQHTRLTQVLNETVDIRKTLLLLKIVISSHQYNSYSILIHDARRERTLALKLDSLASDQKQTVALLREMDVRYRALFDSLSEGVIFVSNEGQILAANESAAQIFRTTVAELISQRLDEPVPFRVIGEDLEPLPRDEWPAFVALASGQPRQGAIVGLWFPSGQPMWLEINTRPLWRAGEPEPYAAVMSFYDVTLRKELEAELQRRAFHDPLTSLPNRSLFVDRLDIAIRQARRTGDLVVVFFLDLDGFKEINDAYGHEIGDRFLQTVARKLSVSLRDGDTVARFGGDEFTVMLPAVQTTDDALRVAERLLEDLQQPVTVEGLSLKGSASLGISVCPHDGQESATLLRNADQAMYRVKSRGRNGCCFFREENHPKGIVCLTREDVLAHELGSGSLKLRYWPFVDLATEQIVGWGAEWYRLPSERAAPVSRELSHHLFRHLFEQVCRELTAPTHKTLRPPLIVRVEPPCWPPSEIVLIAQDLLNQTGAPPELVELEIVLDKSPADVAAFGESLVGLHGLGVRLSLSLAMSVGLPMSLLFQVQLQSLTLPETLWRRAGEDPRFYAVCEGVVAFAQRAGLFMTARDLRSQADRALVQKLGCQRGQGLLWPAASHPPHRDE